MKLNNQELCNQWLNLKQKELKPASYDKYNKIIHKYLIDFFNEHDICSLNEDIISEYFQKLLMDGLSSSLIKVIKLVLKSIYFSYEEEYELRHIDFSLIKIETPAIQQTLLSRQQQYLLYNKCIHHISSTNLSILLALFTGIRIGELCALKVKEVDIEHSLIYINNRAQRISNDDKGTRTIYQSTPLEWPAKRTIIIPDVLIEYLKEYLNNLNQEYYLLSKNLHLSEVKSYQTRLSVTSKSLGFNTNYNCLRNTYKENSINNGMNIKVLMELLGIQNITLTIYQENSISNDLKQLEVNKYNNNLFNY